MVTRDGYSYSGANVAGDVTINGAAPRNGGVIRAQNNQAAENLAAGFRPGMGAQVGAAAQPQLGFGPGSVLAQQQAAGFTGSIGQQSGNGNMWSRTPEQQRRDAEVQASSIHKPTAAIGSNAIRSMDAQDLEGVRGANALQQEIARIRGANYRADVQERGANQRSIMQALQSQQRLALDRETQGIKNQGQSIIEALRAQVAAETDPTKRKGLYQHMLEAEGRNQPAEWGVQVTPTTKNVDGSTSMGSIVRYNKATGQAEIVQQPGQGAPAPLPAREQLSQGQVYQTARGPARWNGSAFDPV